MEISDYRNPEEFQALVRTLMLVRFGPERYQVVDDSGGDGGLDGFDRENGVLHAVYCPEKPERTTPARLASKYRGDLKKAVVLRDKHRYPIRVFAFVTPQTLREPDQRAVREAAIEAGFDDGICIGGEALGVTLNQHPELVERFPDLAFPRLERQLIAIREEFAKRAAEAEATAPGDGETLPAAEPRGQAYDPVLLAGVESPDLEQIEEALLAGDESPLPRLALLRAEATDRRLLVAADLVEQGFLWGRHQTDAAIVVCERGVREASRLGMAAEEATLRALLARHLAVKASELDMQQLGLQVTSHRVGMRIYDPPVMQGMLERLRGLTVRMESEINTALRMVQGGGVYNLQASYWVYASVAAVEAYTMSARQIAVRTGLVSAAELQAARSRVLEAHQAAVRMVMLLGPTMRIQALENAANDLRLAGDPRTAMAFALRALDVSRESGEPAKSAAVLVSRLTEDLADPPAAG